MTKLQRLLATITLLLNHTRLSATFLADTFSVSKRTIYRDIETLEGSGLPIVSYSGQQGGFALLPNYKLTQQLFTEDEKNLLLNALRQQKELIPVDNFLEIEAKLHGLLQQEMAVEKINLDSSTLHRPEIEKSIFDKITWLRHIILTEKNIEIQYISLNGDISKRIICPKQLNLTNGSWYLEAFCYLRKAVRFFKLTRIQTYQQVDKFELMPEISLPTVGDNSVDNFLPYQQVLLSFNSDQLGRLVDYFTLEEMTIQESEIIVEFSQRIPAKLLPLLLMFGTDVQILQPVGLAELHLQEIKKIYQHFAE